MSYLIKIYTVCIHLLTSLVVRVNNSINVLYPLSASVSILYSRAPDKREYLMIIFFYFSSKSYVVTPQLNPLIETVQMRVTKYVFMQN